MRSDRVGCATINCCCIFNISITTNCLRNRSIQFIEVYAAIRDPNHSMYIHNTCRVRTRTNQQYISVSKVIYTKYILKLPKNETENNTNLIHWMCMYSV